MTPAHLQQWIQHPESLNRDTLYELRTLVARYPYFQSLRLLYLKNLYLLHDINFGAELRKAVLYVSDRRVLFYIIEGDKYVLRPHTPVHVTEDDLENEPSIDRTLSLIDAFLSTIPEEQSQSTELDYVMDYTSYLIEDEKTSDNDATSAEVPKLRGQDLIDGFIMKSEAEEGIGLRTSKEEQPIVADEYAILPVNEEEEQTTEAEAIDENKNEAEEANEENILETAPDELDDSCFTETLAKIYIKQHRYDKALEIIKKLSLNYPKKNAYFADQIRFLEKLIINAKSK